MKCTLTEGKLQSLAWDDGEQTGPFSDETLSMARQEALRLISLTH